MKNIIRQLLIVSLSLTVLTACDPYKGTSAGFKECLVENISSTLAEYTIRNLCLKKYGSSVTPAINATAG